jgi:hypothetical protein
VTDRHPSRLPDPAASRAVLIGVADYRHLLPIEAAETNVRDLAAVLTDPDLWGLPAGHCRLVLDPVTAQDLLDPIHEAAEAATDALVVYFAGHGLLDKGELELALVGGGPAALHRAVSFAQVRREIVSTAAHCRAKIVILDCCFSGKAMTDYMAFDAPLADQTVIEGAYLMTATSETVLARAPDGDQHTVFTGSLLRTLRHGVPGGPDPLDMDTVFEDVEADLRGLGEPVPQRRSRNHGHRIALVRNRGAGAQPEVRPPTPEPEPAVAVIDRRRWPSGRLIAAVALVTAVAAVTAFITSLRPDDEGRRTAAPSQTSAQTSMQTSVPSPTPASQAATTSPATKALPKSETLTASTGRKVANQDGRVEIEVFQVSGGLYSYFVITPENSCTVSDTKNGVSTVVPLGGGDWARLVPLRQIFDFDFDFDSATPSEIPHRLLDQPGAGSSAEERPSLHLSFRRSG